MTSMGTRVCFWDTALDRRKMAALQTKPARSQQVRGRGANVERL